MRYIYKVCDQSLWDQAVDVGYFARGPHPPAFHAIKDLSLSTVVATVQRKD